MISNILKLFPCEEFNCFFNNLLYIQIGEVDEIQVGKSNNGGDVMAIKSELDPKIGNNDTENNFYTIYFIGIDFFF